MRRLNIKNLLYCLLIIVIVLVEDFVRTSLSEIYIYYIKPVVWLGIAMIGWFYVRKNVTIKQKDEKAIRITTLIILFTSFYFMLGFLSGFARSPYNRTFLGIIINEYSFVFILVAYEMIRSSLVSSSNSKFQSFIVLLTMICIFLDIEDLIESFSTGIHFNYIFGTLLTCIISQVLLNFIMKHCGIKSTLIWQLVSTAILYIVPILPAFNWFYNILFVSLRALVCYVFLYYTYTNKQLVKDVRVNRKRKPYFTIVAMICLILFVGFVCGIFPYQPIVILSNSMVPNFSRGDIVVVDKNGDYGIDSIIQFENEGINVVHRIVGIGTDENGKTYYITKGDNNNTEDNWVVYEEQIYGTVKLIIPKIGYITIWFNDAIRGIL